MSKKSISIIISVIAIGVLAGVALFITTTERDSGYDHEAERTFHVDDTDKITAIFIAGRNHDPVFLERQNGNWIANGEYPALNYKVDLLMSTIRTVRVRYPVPERQYERAVRDLAARGIKVELYKNHEDDPFHVYYVGNHTSDYHGTYMIRELDGQLANWPYVTHIPGFPGFLTPRYITDIEEWRDLTVFDYDMDDIKRVKVDYPLHPEASYVLKSHGIDDYEVQPLNQREKIERPLYKTGVREYLNSFQRLNAEAFENRLPQKDSILQTTPFAKVSVQTFSGEQNDIRVFYMPVTQRTRTPYVDGRLREFDPERFFASINNEQDLVIIQEFVFGKIFRQYEDFFMTQL